MFVGLMSSLIYSMGRLTHAQTSLQNETRVVIRQRMDIPSGGNSVSEHRRKLTEIATE
jgi:hypothetical protein